jgi:hypothetical protein
MAGGVLLAENDRVDALSVIPNPQSQAAFTVSDVYFDSSRIRMTDRISQGLHSNPIYLVPNDGIEGPWCSLDLNTKLGTRSRCGDSQKVLAEFAYRLPQINCVQSAGAEFLHSISALGNGIGCLVKCLFNLLFGFIRPLW